MQKSISFLLSRRKAPGYISLLNSGVENRRLSAWLSGLEADLDTSWPQSNESLKHYLMRYHWPRGAVASLTSTERGEKLFNSTVHPWEVPGQDTPRTQFYRWLEWKQKGSPTAPDLGKNEQLLQALSPLLFWKERRGADSPGGILNQEENSMWAGWICQLLVLQTSVNWLNSIMHFVIVVKHIQKGF